MSLTLFTPAPASSVAFSSGGRLAVGADDGSIRLYAPPDPTVVKAIRGLGASVSSIIFNSRDDDSIWVASGRRAFLFLLDTYKLICAREDALKYLEIGQDDDDVLNELDLSANRKHLAFSCDSGAAGVVDLATSKVTYMKVAHQNICGSVVFIPDRPNELVSGGYDCAVLHFDFKQGTILSRLEMTAPPPSSGISLSPPFILSLALSPTGLIAVGTADGHIWVGLGGTKSGIGSDSFKDKNRKKRSHKWEGLDRSRVCSSKVAEGPIVGLAFTAPERLVSCTLLGSMTAHALVSPVHLPESKRMNTVADADLGSFISLRAEWSAQTRVCAKVNALTCHYANQFIAVAGFDTDGKKGVVELWRDGECIDSGWSNDAQEQM